MTSVASEASAVLNRPSPSSRSASSKDRSDGGFAALMENQSEHRETRKSAQAERASSRRTEREAPAEKSTSAESAAGNDTPARSDAAKVSDVPAEKPAADGSNAAQPAAETAPALATEEKVGDGVPTLPVALAIPAVPADQMVTTPVVPVVAAPVVLVPVDGPVVPPGAMPAAPPILTGPVVAPVQQPDETAGQTAAPAAAASAGETAAAAPAQETVAASTAAPQVKPQLAVKSDENVATDAQTETGAENAQAGTPEEEALKQIKPTVVQATAPEQSKAAVDKPELNNEAAFKPDDFPSTTKLAADNTSSQAPTHMPAHATAAAAATSQASPIATAQTVPVTAIAVEIAGQAKAGNSRFEIRLDPPELGRIDVRLDVDKDGNVTSRLVIERADTYDLLRRDQSTLERALQQAGLKTSDNSLEFSLRDQGGQQRQNDDAPRGVKAVIAESDILPSEAINGYARLLGGRSGVDIRV